MQRHLPISVLQAARVQQSLPTITGIAETVNMNVHVPGARKRISICYVGNMDSINTIQQHQLCSAAAQHCTAACTSRYRHC